MCLTSFKSHKRVMRQPSLLYPSFHRHRERLRTTTDVPTAHNPCDPQTQAVSGLADSTCSPRMSHDLLLLLRFSQKVRNRRPDLLLQSFTPGYTFHFPAPQTAGAYLRQNTGHRQLWQAPYFSFHRPGITFFLFNGDFLLKLCMTMESSH